VNALLYYKSSQRRFAPFLRLCGLTDIRLYNKFLGEYEMRLILRIFGEIPEGADYPPPEKLKVSHSYSLTPPLSLNINICHK
jgi:hypothetical protein